MFAHLQVHMQMENHYSSAYKGASYKEVHIYGIFQQRSNRSSDSDRQKPTIPKSKVFSLYII